MNLPESTLSIASLTPKDFDDLRWGIEHGVDWVGCSFIRHEDEIAAVQERIAQAGASIGVVAKIEKPEAIDHLEAIIERADGVMVARGDLGVEMPLHEVPVLQKRIIREASLRDRPVITATQMLESMITAARPTRAEVSDVANAIFDGTDAIMLSGETAVGHDPVRVVRTMSRIALAADEVVRPALESRIDRASFADALCDGAQRIAHHLSAAALAVYTATGATALFMSKYNVRLPVLGITDDERAWRRMALYRGITPVLLEGAAAANALEERVEEELLTRGLARPGDVVVLVGGHHLAADVHTTSLRLRIVGGEAPGARGGLTYRFCR
jgi:pyruvate kinase